MFSQIQIRDTIYQVDDIIEISGSSDKSRLVPAVVESELCSRLVEYGRAKSFTSHDLDCLTPGFNVEFCVKGRILSFHNGHLRHGEGFKSPYRNIF